MGWRWCVVAVVLMAVAFSACGSGEGDTGKPGATAPASSLPEVRFGPNAVRTEPVTMHVEVADTDDLRFCGLMHRRSMPEDQGMLFVFQEDQGGPFWNRNTFIPLTLAWITAEGRIVDLTDLPPVKPEEEPQVNTFVGPKLAYRYVIEANQGWYARHRVSIGDQVEVEAAVAQGSAGAVPICREKGR